MFLDCREALGETFASRFPTVYAACKSADIEAAREPIPVAPAAHIIWAASQQDARGRSRALEGLWAVGECASTGLHGANRLASNSLLEALVFGARVANDVRNTIAPGKGAGEPPAPERFAAPPPPHALRDTMTKLVGLERDGEGLSKAIDAIAQIERAGAGEPALLNMTTTAKLVASAALIRNGSRGGHFRSESPATDPGGKRTTFLKTCRCRTHRDSQERLDTETVLRFEIRFHPPLEGSGREIRSTSEGEVFPGGGWRA